jgi:hypothetical protein
MSEDRKGAMADEGPERRVEVSPEGVRMSATPPDLHLERLLDGVRLAVIGVVTTVGLSVGFGVGHCWLGAAAGFGSVILLVAAFKLPVVSNWVACLADGIIGRT